MLQSVLKNSVAVFVFQIVSRGAAFLAFVMLARMLGVVAIGNFVYILSLCALLNLFVEFGTNQFLVKQVASGGEAVQANAILNILLLKFSQFVIGILLLLAIEHKELVTEFTFLNLTLCYVIFEGIAQIGISILYGNKQFVKANAFTFSYEIARSVLLLAFLFFTKDLRFVPVIYILCAFTYALVIFFFVLRKSFSFKGLLSRRDTYKISLLTYYKHTYLFFVAAIAYQLYFRVDMILLKRLSTPLELGIYSTAYKFFEVFLFVPAILSGIIFPTVAGFYHKNQIGQMKEYVKRFQTQGVVLISSLVLLIILFSDLIITVFFGKSFSGSVQIMQILFLTSFLYCFNFIYPVLLNSTGNEKSSIYVFATGFVVNFILNYFLQPHYGAKAAALITLFSECIVTVLYYVYLRKKSLDVVNGRALALTVCCIVLSSIRIMSVAIAGNLLVSLLVFFVFLAIVFFFFKKEVHHYLVINARQ